MKNGRYWPNDRSEHLQFGKFAVHLQSHKEKETYHERILTVTNVDTKQVRSVVHMQFVGWPVG